LKTRYLSMKIFPTDVLLAFDTFHSNKAVMLSARKERVKTVDRVKAHRAMLLTFLNYPTQCTRVI
jgi:hypothetical protein